MNQSHLLYAFSYSHVVLVVFQLAYGSNHLNSLFTHWITSLKSVVSLQGVFFPKPTSNYGVFLLKVLKYFLTAFYCNILLVMVFRIRTPTVYYPKDNWSIESRHTSHYPGTKGMWILHSFVTTSSSDSALCVSNIKIICEETLPQGLLLCVVHSCLIHCSEHHRYSVTICRRKEGREEAFSKSKNFRIVLV